MKKFDIYYNDGAYYGTMTFNNVTQKEIESEIQVEIENNNRNINPMFHITRNNFIEAKF